MKRRICLCIAVLTFGASAAAGVMPGQVVGVSPGGPTGRLVDQRCPTFSWASGKNAPGVELAVHALGTDGMPLAEPEYTVQLPAGAQSWTPDATRCFTPGREYAWSIRGVSRNRTTDWSEPLFFGLAPAPGPAEVEAALGVLRRHLENRGSDSDLDHALRVISRGGAAVARPGAAGSGTAAAPRRGSEPLTGTKAGVHGGAYSLDGSGAITANAFIFNCTGTSTFHRDMDGDSYGNDTVQAQACSAPNGWVADNTDCNDSEGGINPGVAENCGGSEDLDCDGLAGSLDTDCCGSPATYCRDADADTYGDILDSFDACDMPSGYVTDCNDCDDGSAAINPEAVEVCDGIDNDCDTQVDEGC